MTFVKDIPARDEKVEKLRTKILKEIDIEKARLKDDFSVMCSGWNEEGWKRAASELMILYGLEMYVSDKDFFKKASFSNNDGVCYYVREKTIDILLQEDYNVAIRFVIEFAKDFGGVYCLCHYLNDDYFGYDFVNIFEEILFDKKHESCEQ